MRIFTVACLVLLTVSCLVTAQVTATSPNQLVTAVAGNMQNSGNDMAIDAVGNAYLMGTPSALHAGTIAKIDPDGTVHENFHNLGPWNQPGQMCTNPADGQVYFPWNSSPVIGPSGTDVWRIDPVQGAVLHFTTDVHARGFTIDNAGNFYLGGFSNVSALSVRMVSVPITVGAFHPSTFVTSGFGSNHRLLSMADGSLLIGNVLSIERFQPPSATVGQSFFSHATIPGTTASFTSIARSSLNESGQGALVGIRETANSPGYTGMGYTWLVKPSALASSLVLQEPFITNGIVGTYGPRCFATRVGEEILYYTHNTSPQGMPHSLFTVRQMASTAAVGSLMVTATPGLLSMAVVGNAPGGHPVQVSVTVGHVVVPGIYLPYGILELDPLNPSVLSLANGLGLGGSSDGSAISNSGVFTSGLVLPPGLPVALPITLEGLILDSAAPNGLFYETNAVWTALP